MSPRAIMAAIIVAICWGGNYSATKFGLADFPPFLMLLLRFIGVSLLLFPFALRRPIPNLRHMFVIAMLLIVIQFATVFTAMHIGLSVTTTIIATQLGVPFSCVMAAIIFKDFLGPWRSFGLVVAFIGALIVAGTPNAAEHWGAFLLAVIGAWSWSAANLYIKYAKAPPSVVLLFWPALFSVPPFFLLTLFFEHDQIAIVSSAHWSGWGGIVYSMIFASLVGYGLWNWLITHNPLSRVIPYGLLMPIAGITIGTLIFHEPLTMQVILGGVLTIIGVGIISIRRPKLVQMEL